MFHVSHNIYFKLRILLQVMFKICIFCIWVLLDQSQILLMCEYVKNQCMVFFNSTINHIDHVTFFGFGLFSEESNA